MRRLVDDSAQVVEVLPPREFAGEHLPGAMNVPLKSLSEAHGHTAGQASPGRRLLLGLLL